MPAFAQTVAVDTAVIRPAVPGDTNWRMEFFHGRMRIQNRSVRDLIKVAYVLSANSQLLSAPPWVLNEHYDLNGTFDAAATTDVDQGTAEQRNAIIAALLRGLLAERFHLQVHEVQVLLPVYALTVARQGIRIQPTQDKPGPGFHGIVGPPGKLDAHGVTMELFASRLTSMRDADERLVVDETGVHGAFDWSLRWNPDPLSPVVNASESDTPSLFIALEQQLGLKLIAKRSRVPAVVIDGISHPSEN